MGVLTFKRLAISLFVLAVALTGLVVARFYWPALPHVNYEQKFQELCEQTQPPNHALPNLEPELRRILDELKSFEEQNTARRGDSEPLDWSVVTYCGSDPAMLKNLDAMAEELENLRQTGFFERTTIFARNGRFLAPPPQNMANAVLVDYFGPARKLSLCLTARLRRAIEHDDDIDAGKCLREILGLSQAVMRRPLFVDYLVGMSFTTTAMDVMKDVLPLSRPSPTLLRSLRDAMMERPIDFDPRSALKGEKIFALANDQQTYEEDRSIFSTDWVASWRLIRRTHGEQVGITNRVFDLLEESVDAYPRLDPVSSDKLVARIDQLDLHGTRSLIGSLGSIYVNMLRTPSSRSCIRDGTLLYIAIRLYEAERGMPPSTLNELVPFYLPEFPSDPFATDGAFVYRPQPLPLPSAPSFTLYSVGLDGKDNGGTPSSKDHLALFDPTAAGTDYIFGLPPAPTPTGENAP
ncbi:MAG TPA: hypothetical protein VG797_11325 [Phycisphaerales bacterium]|nr:hypothetical protein [Phycisphaerales bacterium]